MTTFLRLHHLRVVAALAATAGLALGLAPVAQAGGEKAPTASSATKDGKTSSGGRKIG